MQSNLKIVDENFYFPNSTKNVQEKLDSFIIVCALSNYTVSLTHSFSTDDNNIRSLFFIHNKIVKFLIDVYYEEKQKTIYRINIFNESNIMYSGIDSLELVKSIDALLISI